MLSYIDRNLRFCLGRNDDPAMAAKPPTNPPTKAVTSTSKTDEPPSGNTWAIL